MDWFDLMSSEHFHVILHPDKKHGLIFNRLDDTVSTINHDDAKELCNLKRVGRVYGIIGRYLSNYLVLIKNRAPVGLLYDPKTRKEHQIYVITQVQVIDVSCVSGTSESTKTSSVRYDAASARNDQNSNKSCSFKSDVNSSSADQDFSSLPITISTSSYRSVRSRAAPWNPFRLANSLKPRIPTQFLRSTAVVDTSSSDDGFNGSNQVSQADESDKRLVEEMIKLFNNTNSFYFSPTLDLTNRFSRSATNKSEKEALWKTADKQFFWNRHMLKDLIELSERNDDANYFIRVILQGFITIENHATSLNSLGKIGIETGQLASSTNSIVPVTSDNGSGNNNECDKVASEASEKHSTTQVLHKNYQLALVSRRSVYHAGTRYRRRGCDEEGNCANFVETEQIFRYNKHFTSVVILRGSIPLFWYQRGYNYRPPPVLYRSDEENHKAFVMHFNNLIERYKTQKIISIDCTEQTGREKCLHDAYKNHMEKLRASKHDLKLIEFDFHKLCRGRQCSDIQVEKNLRACGLTDDILKDARYYWNDGELVWDQGGVFRVNCLDCSDRTNVVQRAIALQILDQQLSRLGVIAPDTCPDDNEYRRAMQIMWSTNGNVLSTQYCGTQALFTGDRKLAGYLKDTYSSASRYYISKFRDAYRQAAIDAMLGVESTGEPSPGGQADHGPPLDQYELINLDPMLSSRGSGALFKDVGSKVTDKLARLKGRFYVKPLELDSMNVSSATYAHPDLIDTRISETLDGLNIDWPSSESVENIDTSLHTHNNVFAQFSNSDDSFQDDEFGQLMLSIDLADLQRLRDDEYASTTQEDRREEINMTEACGPKNATPSDSNLEVTTSTTTT